MAWHKQKTTPREKFQTNKCFEKSVEDKIYEKLNPKISDLAKSKKISKRSVDCAINSLHEKLGGSQPVVNDGENIPDDGSTEELANIFEQCANSIEHSTKPNIDDLKDAVKKLPSYLFID